MSVSPWTIFNASSARMRLWTGAAALALAVTLGGCQPPPAEDPADEAPVSETMDASDATTMDAPTEAEEPATDEPATDEPDAMEDEAALEDAVSEDTVTATAVVTETPLLPRDLFFGNPTRTQGRISPDGTQVSFIAPLDGVLNVWVGPADAIETAAPVTRDTGRGIRFHGWSTSGEHVLYLQDKGGDENFRLYSVDVETSASLDLTPFDDMRAVIIGSSIDRPDELLVGLNNRDERWHDVWLVNTATGERSLVEENNGFGAFVADHDLALRLAVRQTPDGGQEVFKRDAEGAWASFFTIAFEDTNTTDLLSFTRDGRSFYMLDSTDRDTAALVLVDYDSGERTVIADDSRADVSDVLFHPTEDVPLAYAVNYTRTEWTVLDERMAPAFAVLDDQLTGDVSIVAASQDNGTWVIAEDRATAPGTYSLLDREAGTLAPLFVSRPDLVGQPLNETFPEVIPSRDGLSLVSYLTLPQGTDADGDGRPDQPLPLVLDVHGGPWARDSYGYDAWRQWLSNRGYAHLNVNFRGSSGFGKAFLNAGDQEWGAAMHDDLIDAVDWAVAEGITTADAVAIAGGSYGGYATLAGLTFTPDRFACGVSIVGPSNLITLLESIPPSWTSFFESMARRVGDPRTEEGRELLRERSPLTQANAITRPLLIGQGANDPRVKQAESDQIVDAMTANGLPVTYVLFPDEGHGFARPQNRLAFYAIMEAFLGQCLGGRYEPIGTAFEGSSTQVPVGAEHVPDLEAALEGFEPVVQQ